MRNATSLLVVLALAATGCSSGGGGPGTPPVQLAPEIGTGDHSPSSVTFTTIATSTDGLSEPRDLKFNPLRPDELWIVSYADDSVVIVHDASTASRRPEYRKDGYALHFMAEVTAIAFGGSATSTAPIPAGLGGAPGTFATCGESRNTYDGATPPNDFMGPALWSSDLDIFAKYNPTGLGSHIDMLHCSPLCMGLAHESANVYWAFAGISRTCAPTCTNGPVPGIASIVKYDFQADNGIGNDDHSDGTAYQYVTGLVKYEPGVPSHLALDRQRGMLYIADTGNGRVARLHTGSGTPGPNLQPFEPMADYRMIEGATLEDVVPASTGYVQKPSGIAIYKDRLFVSDNLASRIIAFSLDGELLNWLELGLPSGSVGGLTFGPDGRLYFADMAGHKVLRIDAAAPAAP